MKTLFKNALVYDGSGEPPYTADILIDGKIIAEVGADLSSNFDAKCADGTVSIDLEGQAVCPGFIDTHSHSDLRVFETPMLEPKLCQGITTEILGQDGVSMAPLPKEYISKWKKNIAGLEGQSDAIDWEYENTAGYLDLLSGSNTGLNLCYLVPHGNIRMEVMGLGQEKADISQLKQMTEVLRRELDAGAIGLSTGLIYPPCTYADAEEMLALCTVMAEYALPLVIHQRSEADDILESMGEVINLAQQTGVHVHFSHFKICGKYNAPKYEKVLGILDKAKADGLYISIDQYPYVAGSTTLGAILPPWSHAGGVEELLRRLGDKDERAKIIADINTSPCDWDNFVAFAGTDGISITNASRKNEQFIGKTLDEIAILQGTDPVNAALDLILEEENSVSMVDFYGLEEHVRGFMLREEMNLCTDGLLHGTPHPRTYGAFPRFLGRYCRDHALMPIEEGIRKCTSQAAKTFKLQGRGEVKTGYFADLVVFDPSEILDVATFTDPARHPVGIKMVLVNGVIALQDGEIVSAGNGMVIRGS